MKISTTVFTKPGDDFEYEVQDDVIVVEGPGGEGDRFVIGLVNDSLCVNPLSEIPDAGTFDEYVNEWIHAEGTHGYTVIGMATFNKDAQRYEIRPGA